MSADSRLDRAFRYAPVLPLSECSRYVLFSDCHRGAGTSGDNFLKNQHLYFAALQYYLERNFTYIELGDGDELWENRSPEQIKEIHDDVFSLLSRFYMRDRLHMLYGNHDMVKRSPRFARRCCMDYPCCTCGCKPLFPNISFHEGLILERTDGGPDLYLTHGHQADFLNSVLWRLSRFLVRYLWKPLENVGFLEPTSAAKNNTKKKKVERAGAGWAREKGVLLITGHTHRPMLGTPDSPFFNTGSCVHPYSVTCIEISRLYLTLVKWTLLTRPDRTLYVAREEMAEPLLLSGFSLSPEGGAGDFQAHETQKSPGFLIS